MSPSPVVLLVDGDADTREMYATALSCKGFRPILAANAREALTAIRDEHPAVLVTEIVLPEPPDGLQLTIRLREHGRRDCQCVIVLTGRVSQANEEAARRAGADRFLSKPCLPDALVDEIRRVLAATGPSADPALV